MVRRRGEHAWDRRAVVGKGRKLYWIAHGATNALLRQRSPTSSREGLWTKPPETHTPILTTLATGTASVAGAAAGEGGHADAEVALARRAEP